MSGDWLAPDPPADPTVDEDTAVDDDEDDAPAPKSKKKAAVVEDDEDETPAPKKGAKPAAKTPKNFGWDDE